MSESTNLKPKNTSILEDSIDFSDTIYQGYDGTPLRTQADFNFEIEKNKARIALLNCLNDSLQIVYDTFSKNLDN